MHIEDKDILHSSVCRSYGTMNQHYVVTLHACLSYRTTNIYHIHTLKLRSPLVYVPKSKDVRQFVIHEF
jgi:hypothetical protein